MTRPRFGHIKLNEQGQKAQKEIERAFEVLLNAVEAQAVNGRHLALVQTHLEIACSFAKKGAADLLENQELP